MAPGFYEVILADGGLAHAIRDAKLGKTPARQALEAAKRIGDAILASVQ